MFHVVAFLTKQPHLTMDEFIDYYENKHLPLIYSLSGDKLPATYKRSYLHKEPGSILRLPAEGDAIGADVVTEFSFKDRAAFEEWLGLLMEEGNAKKVDEDEANFLVRERTMAYVREEYVTAK